MKTPTKPARMLLTCQRNDNILKRHLRSGDLLSDSTARRHLFPAAGHTLRRLVHFIGVLKLMAKAHDLTLRVWRDVVLPRLPPPSQKSFE